MQHDVVQLFVDDLLLWLSEISSGFMERGGFDDETQRCGRDRVRRDFDCTGEVAGGEMVIVTLEPEKTAGVCVGHEFALARVEIISYGRWLHCRSSGARTNDAANTRLGIKFAS